MFVRFLVLFAISAIFNIDAAGCARYNFFEEQSFSAKSRSTRLVSNDPVTIFINPDSLQVACAETTATTVFAKFGIDPADIAFNNFDSFLLDRFTDSYNTQIHEQYLQDMQALNDSFSSLINSGVPILNFGVLAPISNDILRNPMKRFSWQDEIYVAQIRSLVGITSLDGIAAAATICRYTLEEWQFNNPKAYKAFLKAVDSYNATILTTQLCRTVASAIITGGGTLVPFILQVSVLGGFELMSEYMLKYGVEKIALTAAGCYGRKYNSYVKTGNFVAEFVANHGLGRAVRCKFNIRKEPLLSKRVNTNAVTTSSSVKQQWHLLNKAQKSDYQRKFLQNMLQQHRWRDSLHKINGKRAFICDENGLYYTQVAGEKCDFEVWRVRGKRAKHQGAIECINGTLYEGPKHQDASFD